MNTFGSFLRQSRLKAGMSMVELGHRAGLNKSYIWKLENNYRGTPPGKTIVNLANVLNVPYVEMMRQAGHLTIDENTKLKEILLMTRPYSPVSPKLPKKLFGEYLKQARIAAGFTLDQISDKTNITSNTLSRYESGDSVATLHTLKRFERFYDLKRYELTDRAGFQIREDYETVEPNPAPVSQPGTIRVVSNLMDWPEVPQAETHPANHDPNDICAELLEELVKARTKHPKPFNSAHEGYAILKEEVEELWEDIKRDNFEHARKELVQVGAMAIRFLLDVDLKQPKPIWTRIPATDEATPVKKPVWKIW